MFLCYLIDPLERSVTKVSNGFDRAATLLEAESLDMTNIWTRLDEGDESTIDMVTVDENELESPLADTGFAFTLRLGQEIFRRHFAGKGVLVVCGNLDADVAAQVATTGALDYAVEFRQTDTVQEAEAKILRHTVSHWSKHPNFVGARLPSRRAATKEISNPNKIRKTSR